MRNLIVVAALALLAVPLQGQQGRAQEALNKIPPIVWAGSTPALEEEKVKKAPKLEEFIGKWTGHWDGFWNVQFTIAPLADNADSLSVIYEWEESKGQPLQRRELIGKIEGNTLAATGSKRLINISLHAADPNSAQAHGLFANPRRADLTREKPKE